MFFTHILSVHRDIKKTVKDEENITSTFFKKISDVDFCGKYSRQCLSEMTNTLKGVFDHFHLYFVLEIIGLLFRLASIFTLAYYMHCFRKVIKIIKNSELKSSTFERTRWDIILVIRPNWQSWVKFGGEPLVGTVISASSERPMRIEAVAL